jgi:hypothetical protein
VKSSFAAALVVCASAAFGGDWRDDFRPLQPGTFPLPRPQTGSYRFGWGAVSGARAEIVFSREANDELQLKLTAKTISPVRAAWQMDAEHTARCSASTLLPIWLEQTERYRKDT